MFAEGFVFSKMLPSDPLYDVQQCLFNDLSTLQFGDLMKPIASGGATTVIEEHSIHTATTRTKELEWVRIDLDDMWAVVPHHTSFAPWSYAPQAWTKFRVTECEIVPPTSVTACGTVILTSGAIGVYEAQKREIMALLSRGVNVLGFNYRGYGRSDGVPNGTSMFLDMEAAKAYLEEIQGITDNASILVKSLCMSGIAGVRLAGSHPGMHLMLDQTYSDFRYYLDAEVRRVLHHVNVFRILPKHLSMATEYLVSVFVQRHAPEWNVTDELPHVTGHVGLIISEDDVNTPKSQAMENIRALLQAGNRKVSSYVIPGEHAAVWLDCVAAVVTTADLTSTMPIKCVDVLIRQAPRMWQNLVKLIRAFQDTVQSESEYDDVILLDIQKTLSAIHVKHEPTEVRLQRLKNVCCRLLELHRCKQSFASFLLESSPDGDDGPCRSQMLTFHSAPHPGREAVDDFLRHVGFFKPLQTSE